MNVKWLVGLGCLAAVAACSGDVLDGAGVGAGTDTPGTTDTVTDGAGGKTEIASSETVVGPGADILAKEDGLLPTDVPDVTPPPDVPDVAPPVDVPDVTPPPDVPDVPVEPDAQDAGPPPDGGCAVHQQCDDGNPCTTDACGQDGQCTTAPVVCTEDGNPCTDEVCDGGCKSVPNTASCSDGNPCTDGDTCKDTKCEGGSSSCQCATTSDCAAFDDKDACNGTLVCTTAQDGKKSCTVDPATIVTCTPPDAACKKVTCVPATGQCEPGSLENGSPCDDNDVCTKDDACTDGTCGGAKACQCDTEADCDALEDGDLCNGTLECKTGADGKRSCEVLAATIVTCEAPSSVCKVMVCAPKTGECSEKDAGATTQCNDGNECTKDDLCTAGQCGGTTLSCDDSDDCTTDDCDTESGCVNEPITCSTDGDCILVADCAKKGGCVFAGLAHPEPLLSASGVEALPSATDTNTSPSDWGTANQVTSLWLGGDAEKVVLVIQGTVEAQNAIVAYLDLDYGAHTGVTDPKTLTDGAGGLDNAVSSGIDFGDAGFGADAAAGTVGMATGKGMIDGAGWRSLSNTADLPWLDGAVAPLPGGGLLFQIPTSTLLNGPLTGSRTIAVHVAIVTKDGSAWTQQRLVGRLGLVPNPECGEVTACDKPWCVNGACTNFETVCDDGVACTKDSCSPGIGCVYSPDDDQCTDGVDCTADTCDAKNGCQFAPVNTSCADDHACTADTCDAKEGCQHAPDDKLCVDQNACSVDTCSVEEGCKNELTDALCDDGIDCSTDTCTETGCKNTADHTACADSHECTTDACVLPLTSEGPQPAAAAQEVGCIHTPVHADCADESKCTADVCDVTDGCKNTPTDALCDDQVACTVDKCDGEGSCSNTPDNAKCDDTYACTEDTCDLLDGCQYAPDDEKCLDAFNCTSETCSTAKGCVVTTDAEACIDGIDCTIDDCSITEGCTNVATNSLCEDGVSCNTDVCSVDDGECLHPPIEGACDDDIACTDDACTSEGCTHTANSDLCFDDVGCTTDSCDATKGCVYTPENSQCDDEIGCTIDVCDATQDCVHTPDNAKCDDEIVCTVDTCGEFDCEHEAKDSLCTDGHECTDDWCDLNQESNDKCRHMPDNSLCDDGFECTFNDCSPDLGCNYEPNDSDCDDDHSCSTEVCDLTKGCVYTLDHDQCADDITCSIDACTVADGCTNTPDSTLCEDNKPCTEDICYIGEVNGCSNGVNCQDGILCTLDSCDPVTFECKHVLSDAQCADGTTCTVETCHVTLGCIKGKASSLGATVDGVIGADWQSPVEATNALLTDWGVGKNELSELHVSYDATNLYVGIKGRAEAQNSIVAYVDTDFGKTTGIKQPTELSDNTGILDDQLSGTAVVNIPGFGAEFAFGSVGMASNPSSFSESAGWRSLTNPADLAWLEAPLVADAVAGSLETSIPLATLFPNGVPAQGLIGIIVAMTAAGGTVYSNQFLPMPPNGELRAFPFAVSGVTCGKCVNGTICGDGVCTNSTAALPKDDNDPCTLDQCDSLTGITHTPIAGCIPPPKLAGEMAITEILYNAAGSANEGAAIGNAEWIEVLNTTGATVDLKGCTIADNATSHTITASVPVASGAYAVLTSPGSKPFTASYVYSGFFLTNSGDTAKLTCFGTVIDQVVYLAGGTTGWPTSTDGRSIQLKASTAAPLATNNDNKANWFLSGCAFDGSTTFGTPLKSNAEDGLCGL